jgi:hypothetical protein
MQTRYAFSLTRVWQHYQTRDFAVVSAYFPGDPENIARHIKLKETVLGMGYGFVEIKGHWVETEEPNVGQEMDEYSLFVPDAKLDDAAYWASGQFHDNKIQSTFIYADQNSIYELRTQDGQIVRQYTKLETNFRACWTSWSEHRGRRWRYSSVTWFMGEPPPLHPQGWAEHRYATVWRDQDPHEFIDGPRLPTKRPRYSKETNYRPGPSRMKHIYSIMSRLWPDFQSLWYEVEQHAGQITGAVLFHHRDVYAFTSWDCPISDQQINSELRQNLVLFSSLAEVVDWIGRLKNQQGDLATELERALGARLGKQDFVILPDLTLVSGMARGKVMLDQNINDLKKPLEDQNFRVIVPEMLQYAKKPDDKLAAEHLSNSIFITENYDDFVPLARKHEFGIIGVPQHAKVDRDKIASLISKAVVRHKVWSQTRPFKLLIHGDGTSEFRYLDADPTEIKIPTKILKPKRKRN